MHRPSPWLSRVQVGSRRDKHTKAISVATNVRLEIRTSVLFTSQTPSIIYIQRSAASLSEDFRSVNVGRLHCGCRKNKKELKQSDVKRAGLWQCHLRCVCTAEEVVAGQRWEIRVLTTSLWHTHADTLQRRACLRKEVSQSGAVVKAAEYDNLRGPDRPCCQKRWPSSCSLCYEQERKQNGQKWQGSLRIAWAAGIPESWPGVSRLAWTCCSGSSCRSAERQLMNNQRLWGLCEN